jgi:hypothetical protein
MRRALVALFLLAGCALAGCATLAKDESVCPEYRDLRCPAGASCSMDQARGCRVCQCNAFDRMAPMTTPDTNLPPQPR